MRNLRIPPLRIMAALLVGILLSLAHSPAAFAGTDIVTFAVDGLTVQTGQLAPPAFSAENGDIVGRSSPAFLICPGVPNFSGVGPLCTAHNPQLPFSPNGFQGSIVADEVVVRQWSLSQAPVPFTFEAEQFFSGFVVADGEKLFGTMIQTMSLTGVLNSPAGVDCFATPEDMRCGAASFSGTWSIVQGSGTGDLTGIRGGGAIFWQGCADPNDISTCTLPVYQGVIEFGPDLYLPAILQ